MSTYRAGPQPWPDDGRERLPSTRREEIVVEPSPGGLETLDVQVVEDGGPLEDQGVFGIELEDVGRMVARGPRDLPVIGVLAAGMTGMVWAASPDHVIAPAVTGIIGLAMMGVAYILAPMVPRSRRKAQ